MFLFITIVSSFSSNGVGEPSVASLHLKVLFPPVIRFVIISNIVIRFVTIITIIIISSDNICIVTLTIYVSVSNKNMIELGKLRYKYLMLFLEENILKTRKWEIIVCRGRPSSDIQRIQLFSIDWRDVVTH